MVDQHRDWIASQLTPPAGGEGVSAAGRRTYRYPPTVNYYSWATTHEVASMTIEPARNGPDARAGLMYTQYYNPIKAPFDAQKHYVFDGENLESLMFDERTMPS
ncbi:hypothetical protein SEPCBS119000_006697 [Sporothrix epigloea]|uniref:Uncharacterized protein n=1 Tax=Sporothrix epigloea TaxID=1892477 RepID=A0ABP0E4E2_9PEZI